MAGIDALKRSPGGDILLLGSPTLVRWLLSHDLLDEFVLLVFPVVVGSGPRLLEDMPVERVGLRLTDSRALESGALSLRYATAARPGPAGPHAGRAHAEPSREPILGFAR